MSTMDTMNPITLARLRKETQMLTLEPPPGVSGWLKDEKIDQLFGRTSGDYLASSPRVA